MLSTRYFKYFALFLLSAAICYGIFLSRSDSAGYHVFSVVYGKYNYPFITTNFQGKTKKLGINIGCRFPLFLSEETLNTIPKQLQGSEICYGFDGTEKETLYYLLPKLQIGDLALKNIAAYQTEEEEDETLGKFLGGEFNLLLDFVHDRIVVCDSFAKLEAKKIVDRDWIQVPFEMHRAGIVFDVGTDFGIRRFIFNTACTRSCVSSRIFSSNLSLPYLSSSFILGKHQFPNVTFECVTLPGQLTGIDGLVGMDFMKEHPIYFDYANKIAYIAPSKKYFERIPVTFTKRNDPLIDVSFEGGHTYSLKLDLGNSFAFSLGQEILDKITKTKYGTSKWHDFKGREYETPIYTDSTIKIGNIKFYREFINQDSEEFHKNATVFGEAHQFPGMIGLPILEKYNLFIDFPDSVIYASKDLTLLQEAGLFSNHFLAIPFTSHPDGIFLNVETDDGKYRLMFDTGASTTIIRAPHSEYTAQFRIMGHDFGRRLIKELDVCPQFDFDGFLGMDFFLEYPIFIDYSNKTIFIDLQKNAL